MRHIMMAAAAVAIVCAGAGKAEAGVHQEALKQCMARSTTEADRNDFMAWLFVAISAHPSVQGLSRVTPEVRDAASQRVARAFTRLMTKDCRAQTLAVMRYEGMDAFGAAMKEFGQSAGEGLMQHPAVNAELERLVSFMDEKDFQSLGEELAASMR